MGRVVGSQPLFHPSRSLMHVIVGFLPLWIYFERDLLHILFYYLNSITHIVVLQNIHKIRMFVAPWEGVGLFNYSSLEFIWIALSL